VPASSPKKRGGVGRGTIRVRDRDIEKKEAWDKNMERIRGNMKQESSTSQNQPSDKSTKYNITKK